MMYPKPRGSGMSETLTLTLVLTYYYATTYVLHQSTRAVQSVHSVQSRAGVLDPRPLTLDRKFASVHLTGEGERKTH